MCLPRFRFTVRRLMVAVAVVALILGLLRLRPQSIAYHQQAEDYAWVTFHPDSMIILDGQFASRNPATRIRDPWAWKMAEKYWRLSDYPWLPDSSDPPPPP
jgi:hypothetical protein